MIGQAAGKTGFRKLFPQHHIPVILLSILQAGSSLYKKSDTDREDWLTTRLHRRIIREPTFRDGPLHISLQPEVVNTDVDRDTDTIEGRLDLQVSCNLGYETYFAIEAKRLHVSLPSGFFSGGREYVVDGMMRFVTGKYAPFMQAGAMLGYVYDADKDNAHASVNKQIQREAKELKLKAPKKLVQTKILPDYPIDETNHGLDSRLFTLYHIFLVV